MSFATLLLPDFTLIVLGLVLVRVTDWGAAFWSGSEKLVYYVLFPALLFYASARAPIDFAVTGKMLETGLLTAVCGIALGWLAKPLFRPRTMIFESGAQTAFRFNSYIALAAAARLAPGDQGTSLIALVLGFAVPLCNVAAVHALVHKNGGLVKELMQNPLLIATVAGLAFNFSGLHIPEVLSATLSRLGNASIALGLIMVGAGLRLSGLHESKAVAAYFIAVKLMALPLAALLIGRWLGLPLLQLQIAVLFGALPTASSAFVLAARMGGNAPFVAFIISAQTLLSIATLPMWVAIAS
jgi:hypothetical protein